MSTEFVFRAYDENGKDIKVREKASSRQSAIQKLKSVGFSPYADINMDLKRNSTVELIYLIVVALAVIIGVIIVSALPVHTTYCIQLWLIFWALIAINKNIKKC